MKKMVIDWRSKQISQDHYQVTEVVAGVEGKPFDILHQDEARDEHQLGEGDGIDAFLLVFLELDARVLKL